MSERVSERVSECGCVCVCEGEFKLYISPEMSEEFAARTGGGSAGRDAPGAQIGGRSAAHGCVWFPETLLKPYIPCRNPNEIQTLSIYQPY